jgi:hypothetical protein
MDLKHFSFVRDQAITVPLGALLQCRPTPILPAAAASIG